MKTQISSLTNNHSVGKCIWDRKKRVDSLEIEEKFCEVEVTGKIMTGKNYKVFMDVE